MEKYEKTDNPRGPTVSTSKRGVLQSNATEPVLATTVNDDVNAAMDTLKSMKEEDIKSLQKANETTAADLNPLSNPLEDDDDDLPDLDEEESK